MYTLTLEIYQGAATKIYEALAELYKLPTIVMLVTSIDEEIDWQPCEPETQVYYIDNLRETNRRHLFQVRFRTSPDARELSSIFISVEKDYQVHTLSLQFPPKGDRGCSSRIIAFLKRWPGTEERPEFEVCGFGEREGYRFIREHSLSAFVWDDSLQRYLHVTDHASEVKERQRGIR